MLLLCEFYRITPNELLGYDEMARVAVICDKYDIHYKTIDSENVIITNRGTEYKIPKAIFAEIVFRSERMINHVVIQSKHLQELREYETSLIKGFIDYEIYFSDKCEYTLEEMDKDLEKIETDKNETIIEIDGKKMQIDADVSTAGYKNNLQDIIATVKRCRDSARDTIEKLSKNPKLTDKDKDTEEIMKKILTKLTDKYIEEISQKVATLTKLTDKEIYERIFENLNLTEEQKEQFVKAYMEKLESKKGGKK